MSKWLCLFAKSEAVFSLIGKKKLKSVTPYLSCGIADLCFDIYGTILVFICISDSYVKLHFFLFFAAFIGEELLNGDFYGVFTIPK